MFNQFHNLKADALPRRSSSAPVGMLNDYDWDDISPPLLNAEYTQVIGMGIGQGMSEIAGVDDDELKRELRMLGIEVSGGLVQEAPINTEPKQPTIKLVDPVCPVSPAKPINPVKPAKPIKEERSRKESFGEGPESEVFNEDQKVGYVALVYLCLADKYLKVSKGDEKSTSFASNMSFLRRLLRRLYDHLGITKQEQQMIETMRAHGIEPKDIVIEYRAKVPGEAAELIPCMDEELVMDVRWTIIADLFLMQISDGMYDARGRVLLRQLGEHFGIEWEDVIKLERRIVERLNKNEEVAETLRDEKELSEQHKKLGRKKRWAVMGLATVGGGLILGLSAGLLAPMIGAGLAAGFSSIGVAGTGVFLGHAGGMALITTGGVLTGGGLAGQKMGQRTAGISHFVFRMLHETKQASLLIGITGTLTDDNDFWLPFSTIDKRMVGDISYLEWEPDMLKRLNTALGIVGQEMVGQAVQSALGHTMLSTLMAGLAWPLLLTKLAYLVDNPWSTGLERARKAGILLADILVQHHHGHRPVSLVGFSLGARVIFYALLELSRLNAYGIIENVWLFGAPVTASSLEWRTARTIVAGRMVNGFHTNDWVLGFLYRAIAVYPVAGLTPIGGLENLDVTEFLTGHMGYRTALPRLMREAGIVVTADDFGDEAALKADVQAIEDSGMCVTELTSTLPPIILYGAGRML